MNLGRIARSLSKTVSDNSPVLLTALGVAGVATTAYLTGKATAKAVRVLDKEPNADTLTLKERTLLLWKLYIPAVTTGAATCGSIVLANRIGTKRAAAMAAAFFTSERAFDEYREKVAETIGKKKEQDIRDEINKDAIKNHPIAQTLVVAENESVCLDKYTGRVFNADMETLKQAQNDANYQLLNEGFLSLNEFYSKLGLDHIPIGEEVGWNSDKLMDLLFTSGLNEKGRPILVMDYAVVPVRNFYKWR